MAEQTGMDNFAAEQREILADRERGWEGFIQFLTWGIVATVAALLALLVFVA